MTVRPDQPGPANQPVPESTQPVPESIAKPTAAPESFFDAVGGHPTFQMLVHRFYQGVAQDPPLRELYPEEDLGPAEDRLRLFLEQYWGGPTTYHEQRGHPRLRLRHVPYEVTPTQRDRWLRHMRAALAELEITAEQREQFWSYFERAAQFMINAPDPDDPGLMPRPGLVIHSQP